MKYLKTLFINMFAGPLVESTYFCIALDVIFNLNDIPTAFSGGVLLFYIVMTAKEGRMSCQN